MRENRVPKTNESGVTRKSCEAYIFTYIHSSAMYSYFFGEDDNCANVVSSHISGEMY